MSEYPGPLALHNLTITPDLYCQFVRLARKQVNAVDIEQICKERLKLDGDEVLNPQDPSALVAAVRQLQGIAEAATESGGEPVVLDPERDLKINQLDLVTAIRERQSLMQVGQ